MNALLHSADKNDTLVRLLLNLPDDIVTREIFDKYLRNMFHYNKGFENKKGYLLRIKNVDLYGRGYYPLYNMTLTESKKRMKPLQNAMMLECAPRSILTKLTWLNVDHVIFYYFRQLLTINIRWNFRCMIPAHMWPFGIKRKSTKIVYINAAYDPKDWEEFDIFLYKSRYNLTGGKKQNELIVSHGLWAKLTNHISMFGSDMDVLTLRRYIGI